MTDIFVIPAVVEPAPAVVGRGRDPSPHFRHPCRLLAGIHPKRRGDRCPINNVGNDNEERIPIKMLA